VFSSLLAERSGSFFLLNKALEALSIFALLIALSMGGEVFFEPEKTNERF
jgi:hypothetical protein